MSPLLTMEIVQLRMRSRRYSIVVLVLVLVLLTNAVPAGAQPSTFRSSEEVLPSRHVHYPGPVADVLHAYDQLAPVAAPEPVGAPVSWQYAAGNPSSGLRAPASAMPDTSTSIRLAHRVLKPNTPLWYRRELRVEEPLVMCVNADDGAQAYASGRRLERYGAGCFVLEPAGELMEVRVRVLNGAMHGGLRAVRLYRREAYDDYERRRERRARLETLVVKLRRWRQPPDDIVEAIGRAVAGEEQAAVDAAYQKAAAWPLVTVGPLLQRPGRHSMRITWETDVLDRSAALFWGRSPDSLTYRTDAIRQHGLYQVALSELAPGTTYYYRLQNGECLSPVYSFATEADTGAFQFTVWADSQSGWPVFQQNVHAMQQYPLAFSVGVGDLVVPGSSVDEWRSFFAAIQPLAAHVPLHLVPGNHDYDGYYDEMRPLLFERYARQRGEATYTAWSYGPARFVALDPNENVPIGIPEGSSQHEWFLDELASPEWQEAEWRFVLVHQPPYGQTWEGYHGEASIRDLIEPLAPVAGIDFVISGHNHAYERLTRTVDGQTTHYLIVGGAGGTLEHGPMSKRPAMDVTATRHHFGRFVIDGQHLRFEALPTDLGAPLDEIEVRHGE